jgi:hypothetical protein
MSTIFNDSPLSLGRIAVHGEDDIVSRAAEEEIKFGRAVMHGTEAGLDVKHFAGAAGVLDGVAAWSTDASELENEKYLPGDPVAVVQKGKVNVYVEEAVSVGDPVRVRHTDEDDSSGYQTVSFASAKEGSDSTGLTDGATTYTASVKVDGSANAIEITGSAAQTFTDLVTELNADLTGAVASLSDGKIKITSSSSGEGSTIEITDTDLFSSLTDFSQIDEAVDGSDDPDTSKHPGNFCTSAVADKTALVSGAKWVKGSTGAGIATLELGGNTEFDTTADT